MKKNDNYNIEEMKKEQVKKIKNSIKKIVNKNKDYYKDKDYAKHFLE